MACAGRSPACCPPGPSWPPTHLAACVPEGLWVVVAGVDPVGGGVDAGELVLVEAQVLLRLLLQDLVGLGLAEGRHLPAGRHCADGRHESAGPGHSQPPPLPPRRPRTSPSISTSWVPTDLVYFTRSERARESCMVFFCRAVLWGDSGGQPCGWHPRVRLRGLSTSARSPNCAPGVLESGGAHSGCWTWAGPEPRAGAGPGHLQDG